MGYRKNIINKEKHKISFEIAAHVFDDPELLKCTILNTVLKRIDISQ